MKKKPSKKAGNSEKVEIDPRFAPVVEAFGKVRDVTREVKKGFGSGALKVRGKIFAMMSSKGQFVAKLPRERVDELVSTGKGERFDPGHGRVMKEWATFQGGESEWTEFAQEAYKFVKEGKQ